MLRTNESRHRMPFNGERMRKVRKLRRVTQKQLAQTVKSAAKMISQYERGVYQPNASTLDAIANALGCSLDYLFERTEIVEDVQLSRDEWALVQSHRRGNRNALDDAMNNAMINGSSGD